MNLRRLQYDRDTPKDIEVTPFQYECVLCDDDGILYHIYDISITNRCQPIPMIALNFTVGYTKGKTETYGTFKSKMNIPLFNNSITIKVTSDDTVRSTISMEEVTIVDKKVSDGNDCNIYTYTAKHITY